MAAVPLACFLLLGCSKSGGSNMLTSDKVAYADMYRSLGTTESMPVRGRLVWEREDEVNAAATTPFEQISQDEIKNSLAELTLIDASGNPTELGTFRTDDEGYFDLSLDLTGKGLGAGVYTLRVQHSNKPAGTSQVRLLSPDHNGIVIRSDVDLTYLNTNFQSSAGLLNLMGQSADERETLPAMEIIYRGLRNGSEDLGGRPVVFLSGSPRFFKRILEGKMLIDNVDQDGLALKPFKDIVMKNLAEFSVDEIIPELKEQIGYKLLWLMRLRLQVAATTREILMGDDSEADVVAYVVYHRFTSGELDIDALMTQLDALEISESWQNQIAQTAPKVADQLKGAPAPVQAIYINKTGTAGKHYPVADWAIEGLTRYHSGSWPLALDLFEEGLISEQEVQAVRERLISLGQSEAVIDQAAADGVIEGFVDQATYERL